jgi:MRG-binding protein
MPPKKKGKASGSTRAASTPVADEDAIAIDLKENEDEQKSYNILKDPWTDEQETSLFKGIIKWKPAGKFDLSLPSNCS